MRTHFRVLSGLALAAFTAGAAQAQSIDPAGSGAITGALTWIQGTLMGTVATVAAVIAIAACGFMMLTGRMNWRYGATVLGDKRFRDCQSKSAAAAVPSITAFDLLESIP